jgi:hypothetical protein
MNRAVLLVAAVWTLAGAPLLCAGGLLMHACECEETCYCDHESDCASDPCSIDVKLRDDTTPDQLIDAGTVADVPAPAAHRASPNAGEVRVDLIEPMLTRLPIPPSDRPLLI